MKVILHLYCLTN